MTIQLELFLPSQSRTGWDRVRGGGQRSTPSFHCPSWSRVGLRPTREPVLSFRAPTYPSTNTPQTLPTDHQSHASKTPFLPVAHLESRGLKYQLQFTVTVKNTVHNTSACRSHLHVQPRLYIYGKRLTRALRNLCSSCSS